MHPLRNLAYLFLCIPGATWAQPNTAALPPVPPVTSTASDTTKLTVISEAQAQAPEQRPSSLGQSRVSVFFSPLQLRALEDALVAYESRAVSVTGNAKTSDNADLMQFFQDAPKIDEPNPYPVFYLSSIVYRTASDWSIWVSGHKITSQKNTTNLEILAVTPTQVSFQWKPVYSEAIATRTRMQRFASPDPLKHKLTRPQVFAYQEDTGTITFTLRPNQSFSPAYMHTFEGFVESPALPPLDDKKSTDAAADTAALPPEPNAPKKAETEAPREPQSPLENLKPENPTTAIQTQLQRIDKP